MDLGAPWRGIGKDPAKGKCPMLPHALATHLLDAGAVRSWLKEALGYAHIQHTTGNG
jgi:site-specific recombinase XerD